MKVVFHDQFKFDLREAAYYYDCAESGIRLGNDFIDEVEEVIRQIVANPLINRVVHRNVRRKRLNRFKPYSVRYSFNVSQSTLRILGVFHGARRASTGMTRR